LWEDRTLTIDKLKVLFNLEIRNTDLQNILLEKSLFVRCFSWYLQLTSAPLLKSIGRLLFHIKKKNSKNEKKFEKSVDDTNEFDPKNLTNEILNEIFATKLYPGVISVLQYIYDQLRPLPSLYTLYDIYNKLLFNHTIIPIIRAPNKFGLIPDENTNTNLYEDIAHILENFLSKLLSNDMGVEKKKL